MRRYTFLAAFFLFGANVAFGRGLLIPVEPDLPPLAMLNHHVQVTLEDQVAVTRVAQTFRNHTDSRLEANYVFPVPAGASVRDFAMWVNGQRVKGELLKADKAKQMYTSIVRQTKNPALLDYIGSDLLSLKVFPVPPKGDQKVEVSFSAVAKKEHDVVEYVYPLETDRTAASTLEEFKLQLILQSRQPIGSIYSPTHDVTIIQKDDHEATVQFERHGSQLDRDFRLFYTHSGQDIGLTSLQHRPISDEDGYTMLLVSPRAELSHSQKVPRDIVFVVDTSGSMMHDNKMKQARRAVRQCLGKLSSDDRFAVIRFATTVERYRDHLVPASDEQIKQAQGWVAGLYSGGGTAIQQALSLALDMRTGDSERMFTVVFFTDGQPTIGETDTEKILADVMTKNTHNTRIFTLGLGDNLNAVFLDQIAERSRALSSYVRTEQDIEARVASFFGKIHHPVLSNLKLSTGSDVRLVELYPPQLPDLFHGDQLVVLARYQGTGPVDVVLEGQVGPHKKKFVYSVAFDSHSDSRPFVEELWARRKVGYLLDQIRINGEQAELVDEVVRLAKNYGIATPYTSYLIMPDAPVQLAVNDTRGGASRSEYRGRIVPHALAGGAFGSESAHRPAKVVDFARQVQPSAAGLARNRGAYQDEALDKLAADGGVTAWSVPASGRPTGNRALGLQRFAEAKQLKSTLDRAYANYQSGQLRQNQTEQLGVNLAVCTNNLKCQTQLAPTAVRRVASRNCVEIGGVWIDEAFNAKTNTLSIKAQSDAYFQLLQRQPQMKEVFQLGNHVVWIAPNGTGLVIDSADGKERMSDREIDLLFASKRS